MMEMDSILSELLQNHGYFPREAVEDAIRRSEEITPICCVPSRRQSSDQLTRRTMKRLSCPFTPCSCLLSSAIDVPILSSWSCASFPRETRCPDRRHGHGRASSDHCVGI